jgi:transcriptional regulator with XRE-family HTH domain
VNATPTPIRELPEELVEFNRERVKGHLSQAIYELMEGHDLSRTELADLLDVGKSRVTQLLSGCENLSAETLADILLVFGRTPYLTLGTDPHEIRFPVDEKKDMEIASTWKLDGEPVRSMSAATQPTQFGFIAGDKDCFTLAYGGMR